MPSYRIGFGSDFNLRDAKVGIGTTLGRTKLDVAGVSKADFNISGVSTLTSYAGLVGQKQNIIDATVTGVSTIGVGTFVQVNETQTGFENLSGDFNTVSEDIIVDEGRIFQVSSGSTVSVGTLEHVSIGTHFSVPNGGISARVDNPIEGSVRFNDDLNTLEFYNGVEWRQFTVTGASGRGVFGGGAPITANIQYINIQSTGNASNFGDLTVARANLSSCSSNTRGVFGGGVTPTYLNTIDYITIASEGNAISFGTLSTTNRAYLSACSSSTRGVFGGGYTPSPANATVNVIDYIQFSTIGNAVDFGDLFTGRYTLGSFSSPTRGIWGGGTGTAPTYLTQKSIEFVTISSTGNATNFGDLTQRKSQNSGCSNSVRGLFMGGSLLAGSSFINTIDYMTIASVGNAITFGDLTQSRGRGGCCSTSSRGVLGGGVTPTAQNTIDYVTIASTGNAQDFGDLSSLKQGPGACSDSHGGLGGF